MTCSIFITRHEDVNHLTPKKGENGENIPPLKRKKGVNYDISLAEFNEMFSKTPPQQSDTTSSTNSGKLNPFNSHIERKDDTTFWIYDPTDFDPWFVARFVAEDTSMTIGSFVEIILSTTAPRFCRNIMNALQVAFKFSAEINVNCFFKDHNKSHQVTADFLKKILYDPHMAFIKGKQKEWLDRMEMIVEKKMAPLEFPLGNIDMIRDFFAFEISNIPDILNVFKHLNKNIPPMLSVAALDANIMEIGEFRSATPEERSVSRINLNDIYSCLIVDRKCKICKCKVEWDPNAKVLRISPNYLAKPPISGLFRCLPFHSVAGCTLQVCKSIMTFLNKPWSECMLHSREMNEDFIKKVQEKLKLDPISIEFYQWIMQAMKEEVSSD
ncbi:predicted protein [Naegleria gruberi]|uniref:Predicted protein n=1 Tax=Naegleria gruberi TaxID=5762 RepID=D2V068_NAEGR|nr:uncharacterized protein NAEGRDRAFT_62189 [Naegleria gruberi]EFC49662.1 predicted protein [Naegleria gruberi]|eukprot:XP_002682406.1 predicted protein [Naegleria gruberi strain NEG-M]